MKILVIKRDKLGDLLLATPLLSCLRTAFPKDEIHLLANDYNAWVVDGNGDIDRRWIYRRVRHAGRVSFYAAAQNVMQDFALRRKTFDWVIVANGEESPRAIARGLAAQGRRCIAYCNDPVEYPRLSDPLPVQREMHEMDRLLALLSPMGVERCGSDLLPHYSLPAEASEFARDWLAERQLTQHRYIVLGLGARRAKKQPSTEQVLRWSRHFKETWGLDTLFTWTPGAIDSDLYPGDDHIAQPVLDERVPYIHPFRGPIRETLGLIWSARTSIFPDSGLMHFAAASPGGVLGLFAETDVSPSPRQWAPRGRRGAYLEATRSVGDLADLEVFERLQSVMGRFSP